MCGEWRIFGLIFLLLYYYLLYLLYLNVFYKLGKGNVVYESNIFEIKLYVYIKFF